MIRRRPPSGNAGPIPVLDFLCPHLVLHVVVLLQVLGHRVLGAKQVRPLEHKVLLLFYKKKQTNVANHRNLERSQRVGAGARAPDSHTFF